jgi:O-antigen/teichoic acid export membrane protein
MRVLRYSGVQGFSLLVSNLFQLGIVVAVANFLGPSQLARFSLLFFLGGIVAVGFSLLSKPGTVRRVFGAGDDDDDEEEEDETLVSASPKRSLGVGLAWATLLGLVAFGLVYLFREQLALGILRDGDETDLIMWAGLMGAGGIVFRLATVTLWLERRPTAFVIGDASRGAIALTLSIVLLATGAGLEGAIAATAIGSVGAAVICCVLLLGSFEPSFDPREVWQIVTKGKDRAPVVISYWTVQNADVFILSKFVSLSELGVYTLASRLGVMVSFAPQGFRVAMRPLRKSAAFAAMRRQYGGAVSRGQLLGYFVLICIAGVLAMVLAADAVVDVAPAAYAGAAALVPLTAAGFVMGPLYRTVNGQTTWPGRTRTAFVLGAILAALVFIGLTVALAPLIDVYAAPVAMIVGYAIPSLYLFARGQRDEKRIAFPYRETGIAAGLALALGGGRLALPSLGLVADIAIAIAGLAVYFALLVWLRVIPEYHRGPLLHVLRSSVSGRVDPFRPRQGIRELEPEERVRLRAALALRVSVEELDGPSLGRDPTRPASEQRDQASFTEGGRLVRMLRAVGVAGGMEMKLRSKRDRRIAELVFVDEPTAVRNATLRSLLDANHDAADLRAVEDVAARLRELGDRFWEDSRGGAGEGSGSAGAPEDASPRNRSPSA